MDPSLINEASFSAVNPSSYTLAGIWPFPAINGGVGGGNGGGLVEESTVTEYSGGENGRKRRDLSSDDEAAKLVSSATTSSGGSVGGVNNDLNDSPAKQMKVPGCNNGSSDPKVAVDGGSAGNKKPAQQSTKPSEPPKDYIHVRARRGQATDSHSLAERARREKISERMKILQDLVPGCNKVIGKALVLDEIINYIQSLQRQVEFLSMKLEAVNSRMNMHPTIEGFHSKDMGAQPFDTTGIMFGPPSTREYSQGPGPQPEWLHMQVGGSFERAS